MGDSLLTRLQPGPSPIIEGNTATFIWKGRTPPALVGDFTGWDDHHPVTMEKLHPGLWIYQHDFLLDAYIEYSFQKGGENIPDPFNPRQTSNGIGGYNSYFSMPDHKVESLHRKNRNIPHGTMTTYHLDTDYVIPGAKRLVYLYRPPVGGSVPLIVVWDGQDYLHRAHMNNIVDNLISLGKIQPLAMAFIDNAGADLRTVEYACSDATLSFLMTEVIPLATRELDLVDYVQFPGAYGVLGASMGGLMALYTSARIPQVFGKVLSQSGAFSWGNFNLVVFDLIKFGDVRPLKIWMDAGVYDLAGLLESNRSMNSLLTQRGYSVTYREYHAGHNYPAWRDEIWRGLEVLFSPAG